ncbi:MAG: thermonuclease family protein [Planctomycetota bacterium]|nr:thermonuclease family protein [Planctomycetota bacterium]
MNKIKLTLLTLLFTSFTAFGNDYFGKCVAVASGDTLYIKDDELLIKVVLYGINAPKNGNIADKAKEFIRDTVFGKEISVDAVKKGNAKEVRGVVIFTRSGIKNLNEEVLLNGWAKVADDCKADFCDDFRDYQKAAKLSKVGIWAADKKNKSKTQSGVGSRGGISIKREISIKPPAQK